MRVTLLDTSGCFQTSIPKGSHKMVLAIAATLTMLMTLAAPAAEPLTPNICWPLEKLDADPRLKVISRGDHAYRRLPRRDPSSKPPEKAPFGAIRRVELPLGSPKLVALTFDLCEQPNEISGYDAEIVGILRRMNIKATLFSGGKWLVTHKKLAQQLMGDPLFELGNHTWEHRNLRLMSEPALTQEIEGTQVAYEELWNDVASQRCLIRDATKFAHEHAPRRLTLFRFPFGACSPASLEAVSRQGLRAIQWDVSSGNSTPGLGVDQLANAVIANVRPGSIVLFHANGRGWKTAKALPLIVTALRKRDFEFVTVSTLINTPGALPDIRPICFDNRPGDTNRYDALARDLMHQYKSFIDRVQSERPTEAHPVNAPATLPNIVPPRPIPAIRPPRSDTTSPY